MEKKIILIMVSLVVVAALVVAFVMVAAGGGLRKAGGFTELFDKLEYTGTGHVNQYLELPDSWDVDDKKSVSDVIVDMVYEKRTVSQTNVYITTFWFAYMGDKWSYPYEGSGTSFFVPIEGGWLYVHHGLFSLTVSSATNLSAHYGIGDVVTLETKLVINSNAMVAFGEWAVSDTL